MANPEHLAILKQGVEVWNEWRIENREIKPDLYQANLVSADLSDADLYSAVLVEAYLNRANLSDARLAGASLKDANLSHANLSRANLKNTNFFGADLSDANLSRADLLGARLIGASLISADLRSAQLGGANLSGARLTGAGLKNAKLSGASLIGAGLRNADLTGANLSDADLTAADLRNAILFNISLQTACLISTHLDGANLTDARLWETQRAGWSIRGVICESVYWDKEAEVKTTYAPGDFERLFAEKTKIKLLFKDGISPLEIATLPALIKYLEQEHPGCTLRLVSIRDDAGGAVVELAIEDEDQRSPEQVKALQAALESSAKQVIEYQRHALVERETRLQLEGEVRQLNSVVDKLILRPYTVVNTQGGAMSGDTYNISGQAGAVGPNAEAHHNTFNQVVNHIEQTIDLAELAKQLGELRQAMAQKQDTSPQADIAKGEIAKAEIAAGEKDTGNAVEHLKASGKWTLDFATEAGKDLVVAVIKQAMGMP